MAGTQGLGLHLWQDRMLGVAQSLLQSSAASCHPKCPVGQDHPVLQLFLNQVSLPGTTKPLRRRTVGEPHTQTHCCTFSSDSLDLNEENQWQSDFHPSSFLHLLSQTVPVSHGFLWSGTHYCRDAHNHRGPGEVGDFWSFRQRWLRPPDFSIAAAPQGLSGGPCPLIIGSVGFGES